MRELNGDWKWMKKDEKILILSSLSNRLLSCYLMNVFNDFNRNKLINVNDWFWLLSSIESIISSCLKIASFLFFTNSLILLKGTLVCGCVKNRLFEFKKKNSRYSHIIDGDEQLSKLIETNLPPSKQIYFGNENEN